MYSHIEWHFRLLTVPFEPLPFDGVILLFSFIKFDIFNCGSLQKWLEITATVPLKPRLKENPIV